MPLSCQVSLNYASYAAGQNPPPMASVFIYNPGQATVVVTSLQLTFTDQFGNVVRPVVSPGMAPTGPGQPVSVASLDDITIGPFPIVVGSAANASSFQAVYPSGVYTPANPQPSQPPQSTLLVGALVTGSDGSVNVAGVAPLLVSYTAAPPLGWQGGFYFFNAPNNFIGWTPGWP